MIQGPHTDEKRRSLERYAMRPGEVNETSCTTACGGVVYGLFSEAVRRENHCTDVEDDVCVDNEG